jgi:(5-formylfuran-3-yl)methyl phosphate synthase
MRIALNSRQGRLPSWLGSIRARVGEIAPPMPQAAQCLTRKQLSSMQTDPSAAATQPHLPPCGTAPQLLVSVQDAEEAQLARGMSVAWIDLKQPTAGSLGAPSLVVAQQVREILRDVRQKSIALGELADLDPARAHFDSRQLVGWGLEEVFPIAKVGLAHMAERENWMAEFFSLAQALLPTQLVPVLYADGERCGAPRAAAVLELADRTSAPFVLIDTYVKDGRRLLDWLTIARLGEFIQQAERARARVVLAGSLQAPDVPSLLALAPAALAVRGAVCDGERTARLCAERVRNWVNMLDSAATTDAQSAQAQTAMAQSSNRSS